MEKPSLHTALRALAALSTALCAALLLTGGAHAADLGLNVYGLSYHLDREMARRNGWNNELNPGLGMRYQERYSERIDWFIDAGAYRDSARNTAIVAGPGAFWRATERIRLGGALALFDSETYNHGRPFIAPIPMLAYETRAATFNLAYFPRIPNWNDAATMAVWMTFWFDRK